MPTNTERVVITGAGHLTALGCDWDGFSHALQNNCSAVREMPAWRSVEGLQCHLGAPLQFDMPKHYSRKDLRSMGRVARLGVYATELALIDAGLLGNAILQSGRMGVAYGSATGSPDALLEFVSTLNQDDARALKATSYLRGMSHTAAVNIGVYFGLTGRVLTTSSACTASSQAIGFAFETIKQGYQDVMLAGGADELTVAHSAVFDALHATSTRFEDPTQTPRPFDRDRDGLVLGEGGSTLVLESLSHAERRGARVLAEVIGFATNADGTHITQPNTKTQARCIQLALQDAGLEAEQIDYVNAHGTATDGGDISEVHATRSIMPNVPMSSLKGHLGHTLGACGGIEAWATIMMMQEGWFAPTLNLQHVDPECMGVQHICNSPRSIDAHYVMSNNFAFGGINTSLIFAPPPVR